jgi:hypothetical protein
MKIGSRVFIAQRQKYCHHLIGRRLDVLAWQIHIRCDEDEPTTSLQYDAIYTVTPLRGCRPESEPKVPRESHAQQDPAKAAELKATLAEKLAALGVLAGAKVRLWVADEYRYSLIGILRRIWSLRGYKPTALSETKYPRSCLDSALEVDGAGQAEALLLPTFSPRSSQLFLEQIAVSDSQAEHIVIWGQAGFHQKTGATLVPRVRILSLPPYCTELNPAEKIGILFKGAIANFIFQTLRALELVNFEELKSVWTDRPASVNSSAKTGYLIKQMLPRISLVPLSSIFGMRRMALVGFSLVRARGSGC